MPPSMPKIVPIVEGNGEVEAVPALLSKLLAEMQRFDIYVGDIANAHGCGNLIRPGGVERFVGNACTKRDCGAILILMDADKQCPVELAMSLSERVGAMGVRLPVTIVIAKCEYEAWFLASLETIAGQEFEGRPGLPARLTYSGDVETVVGAKSWISQNLPKGRIYKETLDQLAMTRLIDTDKARERSRSFRRLCHALEEIVTAIDNGQRIVTPKIDL